MKHVLDMVIVVIPEHVTVTLVLLVPIVPVVKLDIMDLPAYHVLVALRVLVVALQIPVTKVITELALAHVSQEEALTVLLLLLLLSSQHLVLLRP